MVTVVAGTNTGTNGDDLFELTSAVGSFSISGGNGNDRLKADLAFMPDTWSTGSVEVLEFFGSTSARFNFTLGKGGSSRTADVSNTTSEVTADVRSSGSTLLGGSNTFLSAVTDHTITSFDMQSGVYSGTYQDRTLNNTYSNLKGVVSGSGNDTVFGTSGNDRVSLGGGTNTFDGRDGLDKVGVVGARTEFTVTKTSTGLTVVKTSDPSSETTTATNVERVEYFDTSYNVIGQLAFDTDGSAGQTYRLYKAAFNRTPDDAGLSHNVNLMDGGMSILDMASAFIGSAEFQQTYGANIDNTAFLTLLYQNVLNRGPDDAGLAGWLSQMSSGTSREQVLFGFSESGENKANVASAIDDGIWLA